MEFRRYKLFGYLNLFPGLSGFLYPVFLNNGSLYLANGNIRYIYSFSPLKTNYIPFVEKFPCTTESYCPGIIIHMFIRRKTGKFFLELKTFFAES
ncbi:hypothetical protein DXA65_07850 [Ruminococcus sp. OF03-6AA]|nr:hypothetical protein DXA65_07850 [Ruminococcus sp. OF03-6AA]